MNEGEIWYVKFTGEGHEYSGRRPALVIQSNKQLKSTTVITVMPLTSNINNRTVDYIFVGKSSQNNLFQDSLIKVYYIESFDKSRFNKKIGNLEPTILFEVKTYLQKHFGI
jgi:mRNA-degrading endonuclease toxin of MazEF toxin-antitoxin module